MILDIERAWGKYPGWFSELDTSDQAQLLAAALIRSKSTK